MLRHHFEQLYTWEIDYFHTKLNAHCNILILYAHYISFSQELSSGLKIEVAEKLSDLNVSNFVMTPVKVCRWNHPVTSTSVIFFVDDNCSYFSCLRGTMHLRGLMYQSVSSMSWKSITHTRYVSWTMHLLSHILFFFLIPYVFS